MSKTGELHIDLGDDAQDTLNINLNGDEIDTRGFGRHIDHVEYVNVDAPQGDGEAHLQFNGSSEDVSTPARAGYVRPVRRRRHLPRR